MGQDRAHQAAATRIQSVERGNSARKHLAKAESSKGHVHKQGSERIKQVKDVYGIHDPSSKPKSQVDVLKERIAALEKENKMLRLRLEASPSHTAPARSALPPTLTVVGSQ